jgi:hypothetical protein
LSNPHSQLDSHKLAGNNTYTVAASNMHVPAGNKKTLLQNEEGNILKDHDDE